MTEIELVAVGLSAILGGAVNALAGGGTLITFPVLLAVGIPAVAARRHPADIGSNRSSHLFAFNDADLGFTKLRLHSSSRKTQECGV
jgi:uncharacterized membrane protein YfcA